MSNKYDNGYGRGWGNWHGWNGWNGYNTHNAHNTYHGPNGWSWGYWKGHHHQNPNWGYYSHYEHVPRRFGCFKKLFVIGLAFWAGSAYTRHALEGGRRNKCGENKPVVQQTPVVDQTASVNQVAQAPPVQQQSQNHQNEFDYRKSWKSWRKCRSENTQFLKCLNNNDGEIGACQPFFDMVKQCENQHL